MKWRFWRREVEIYAGGIEICNKGRGIDDRDGGKWCEMLLECLYTRKISDFEGRKFVKKVKIGNIYFFTNEKMFDQHGGRIDHAGFDSEIKSRDLSAKTAKTNKNREKKIL